MLKRRRGIRLTTKAPDNLISYRYSLVILLLLLSTSSISIGALESKKIIGGFSSNTYTCTNLAMMSTSNSDGRAYDTAGPEKDNMLDIGFIGCGVIASSIAKGLMMQNDVSIGTISVSRRSESKSSELKHLFPDAVTVCDDNQHILDNADLIFVCVLPQQMESVVGALQFDKDRHILVSLSSTSKLMDLMNASCLSLERNQVYRMICLPAVATCEATCLLVPKVPSNSDGKRLRDLFDALGGCVECKDEDIMNKMMVTTAMMGPIYGIMRNNREWLVKQGVPAGDASYFVARQYMSMVKDAQVDARENPMRFDELIEEQTPGGLNEQALRNLQLQGVFDMYDNAMDAVLNRLEGRSDGSLNRK
mmetsp:Transcript_12915/g.19661  ORF Transcript_12915/g.19661 Transcript_12915/m.19661 type:complete len:363 (-) Transcript_12915:121-1209(-)